MPSKSQSKSSTLKNSHGGYAGPTTIQRLEKLMDRRRKIMEDMVIQHGMELSPLYVINKGRYEGLCSAIALMRGTKLPEEIARSNERLGIE